jgi:transglutaminase-like putative cysteine protease
MRKWMCIVLFTMAALFFPLHDDVEAKVMRGSGELTILKDTTLQKRENGSLMAVYKLKPNKPEYNRLGGNRRVAKDTSQQKRAELERASRLYNIILRSLLNLEPSVNVAAYARNSNDVFEAYIKVLYEHPEIFYSRNAYYYSDGTLQHEYEFSKKQIEKMRTQLNKVVTSAAADINAKAKTDLEKVFFAHEFLVQRTRYDTENYQRNTIPLLSYTAYGALINGAAVCEGYTHAFNLLLGKLGIKSQMVTGTAGNQPHAWNIVLLNQNYYYIDATWNDTDEPGGRYDLTYFLVPGQQLAKDHVWNVKEHPVAANKAYSYFSAMRSVVRSGKTLYYINTDGRLYKMNINGTNKLRLTSDRAYYPVIAGSAIYFSNYSRGGYIYKIDINGKKLAQVNKISSIDLFLKDGLLYYKDRKTGKSYRLHLGK